jgi:hypothetical protein
MSIERIVKVFLVLVVVFFVLAPGGPDRIADIISMFLGAAKAVADALVSALSPGDARPAKP